MKAFHLLLGLAFLLSWLTTCQSQDKKAQTELGAEITPGKVYVYKESAGKPRKMEIYFPANHDAAKARVPGVIMFHGGGWSGGTLGQFRALCQYLASRGLVAATAEYRMLSAAEAKQLPSGETRKRVCITDAKSAIRWFKQHAGELGVDAQRIITGGGSAGGHIAVLATNQKGLNDPKDPQDIDVSVVAYLLFNPAFALDDNQDSEIDVHKQIQPNLAPALVMFGTNDTWKQGWDKLQPQLVKQGIADKIELWLADGQPHGFFNREPWKTVTMMAADRFLSQRGLLQGEATLVAPATGEKLQRAKLE